MAEFSVQQKATIENYRSTHNLGFVVTDEYIAELIKKDMEQPGVVYAGFESLAKSVAKSQVKQPSQGENTKSKGASSIFGTQIIENDYNPYGIEKKEDSFSEIQLTQSQQEAITFLNNLTKEAKAIFENREKEAGFISELLNQEHERINTQLEHYANEKNYYAKSALKSELSATEKDIQLLEQASRGEVGYVDFWGNPRVKSFEEVFKEVRGVKFDEKAIAKCTEKAQQLATIKTTVERINQIKQTLGYTTKGDRHSQINPEGASSAIINAFNMCGLSIFFLSH